MAQWCHGQPNSRKNRDDSVDLSDITQRSGLPTLWQAYIGALWDESPVGCAVVTADGKWLAANTRLCELLGYVPYEIRQRSWQSLTHPDDVSAAVDCFRDLVDGKSTRYEIVQRYLTKSGHVQWVQQVVLALPQPGDAPLRIMFHVLPLVNQGSVTVQDKDISIRPYPFFRELWRQHWKPLLGLAWAIITVVSSAIWWAAAEVTRNNDRMRALEHRDHP